MLNYPNQDFIGLSYPCLILGPKQLPFKSAEIAWLSYFVANEHDLYMFSVMSPAELGPYIIQIGLFDRIVHYPIDYWIMHASRILLQKYEKPHIAKRLLDPRLDPKEFPFRMVYQGDSPLTTFWYDNVPNMEPERQGFLGAATCNIRRYLLEKYSAPLMAHTEIGKHIRAHNLAP